ncbi:MAG: tRNA (N6-isopentenyl adenosine(37)-C2)-methylthiotransferase MiaB [Phycisphaerae bacterium]|nr:tRNA (N6-isopentenyl adenosine(37)-C2)-methylthiotransferase MiaB [Phycisphaerae bacterium]
MNKLDTGLVRAALAEAGLDLTDRVQDADVVLLNTCSVREHAEQRVWSHLGHLHHLRASRPGLVVGVLGCMAQRLGDQLLQHPAVDLVCGPAQIPRVADLCVQALGRREKRMEVCASIRTEACDHPGLEAFESTHASEDLPGQAYVRVMRGCDRFCSYCVVPYVRGPERSRPPGAVLDQVRRLADQGIRQVTLLGQTVNAYRYTAGDRTFGLADLLEQVSGVQGIEWIRFVTSYPSEESLDPTLRAMARLPKVCPHLHIPAQSGSDRILAAMNRRYTAAQYLALLDKARSLVPGLAVAGDFIVGFPGETDEDFHQTADLVRRARYRNCYIFQYSPRPGTQADRRLEDNVPAQAKQARNAELLAVQEQISGELAQAFQGQVVRVLVEGPSKKSGRNPRDTQGHPQLVGRTSTDWIVVFHGPASLAGQFAQVRIEEVSPLTLFGTLCESPGNRTQGTPPARK